MRRHCLIFYFIILLNLYANAQIGKEAWHWNFNYNLSLDFSSGHPILGSSAVHGSVGGEGCASINDSNGQLLFYSDGNFVWDKNNNQMPNGFGLIGGQGTSTQAALIIPKPSNPGIYYLVTSDQGGYMGTPNQGIHYSVIDMSLNGGLGDVVNKNQLLTPPPCTEKLTAVKHCNGIDYWIITHPFNSNSFNAYKVTSSGINSLPVVSQVGAYEQTVNTATIGYLKASPNGKKLALGISHYLPSIAEIYDFDNSTGKVSNPITINYPFWGPYGLSFSPDNTKLYTAISDRDYGELYQYDLSSGDPAKIIASQTLLGNLNYLGALQIGPDNKIYVSHYDVIAVINNPNNLGLSCNFQDSAIILGINNYCGGGLPNFIDAYNPIINNSFNTPLCSFSSYTLNANSGSNYQWQNNDTTQAIHINSYGNYGVSYLNSDGCKETDTFFVTKTSPPVIDVLRDFTVCDNSSIPIINADASYPHTASYLWNDGYSSPVHALSSPGTYWVDYTLNNFCTARDSFKLSIVKKQLDISFPNIVTPNEDNINDYIDFNIYQFSTLQIDIYNRWGNKVFESADPTAIWKPTCDDGSYYYTLQYRIDCGTKTQNKALKGFITIIR